MRYNKDTESTARTVAELDAFRSHKPHATVATPAELKDLERALIKAGWSSTFFNHSRSR